MWDSGDYREHREEQRLRKKLNLAKNRTEVQNLCKKIGVVITEINEHHLRLTKANYQPLDFYPISSKVNVYKKNKYLRVKNPVAYIKSYFE
jgi:transcriptional regulator of NAD metabolism